MCLNRMYLIKKNSKVDVLIEYLWQNESVSFRLEDHLLEGHMINLLSRGRPRKKNVHKSKFESCF